MAGGQRPALSHLDRQRVRPVGAMARRRLGASPPAAPNGAAEGLLAPHGRFPVAPPDGLARRLVGTGAPAEGHVVHMRARSLDGRVRADAKLQVSRPLVGERRVPLKAVAPVRIRSGLQPRTSTTRPLTCRNKGQGPCCVSDGTRPSPTVGSICALFVPAYVAVSGSTHPAVRGSRHRIAVHPGLPAPLGSELAAGLTAVHREISDVHTRGRNPWRCR